MDHIVVDQSTTASPPLPPNWSKNYENTVTSLVTHKLFPVDPNTSEFSTIACLLNSTDIAVEQIVNPVLWLRFLNTRKDMIKSKSSDLNLLSQLLLSREEMITSNYYSQNFVMDPRVASVPYNDNMALLLHCTHKVANIEGILLHGLDDRLGNFGLLGKGIYFTDDHKKAENYDGCDGVIFIFAVLLGDCLHLGNQSKSVISRTIREPEKWAHQRRNINDLFFDSIVARPNTANEYVVYNRYTHNRGIMYCM